MDTSVHSLSAAPDVLRTGSSRDCILGARQQMSTMAFSGQEGMVLGDEQRRVAYGIVSLPCPALPGLGRTRRERHHHRRTQRQPARGLTRSSGRWKSCFGRGAAPRVGHRGGASERSSQCSRSPRPVHAHAQIIALTGDPSTSTDVAVVVLLYAAGACCPSLVFNCCRCRWPSNGSPLPSPRVGPSSMTATRPRSP